MMNGTNRIFVRLFVLALIVALVSPLAACGRKGALERPPGGEYPKQYPGKTTVKPSDEEPVNGPGVNPYTYPNQ